MIAGGGLVGASLAAALAPLPLKIAVLEAVPLGAAQQPSFDDRVSAVSWGSRRIFESIGLWPALTAGATPIRHIHVSDRGRLGVTRLSAGEMRVEALGYVVPNRVLGRALGEFLKTQPQVSWFAPAKLENFNDRDDRVFVSVHATENRNLSTHLLVAADGAQSGIRERLGIEARVWDYGQAAIVANVTVSRPQPGVAFERFTGNGPLALLPMGEDRYALIWTVSSAARDAVLALTDEEFLAAATAHFNGRLGRFLKLGKRQSYPLSLTRAAEQRRGRVLVMGNAAHSLHPIAGQGFNLSLRDVAALADTLAGGVSLGRDTGDAQALDAYVRDRRRDQLGTSLFTDGLNRVFANPLSSVAWARNAGLLALEGLPFLRRWLARHNMGLAGRLPRLARGLPLSSADAARQG